jgi:hypothetical protein
MLLRVVLARVVMALVVRPVVARLGNAGSEGKHHDESDQGPHGSPPRMTDRATTVPELGT